MYFDTESNDHGLPYNPFKGCLIPRPIGWISTRSVDGVNNLAPYSFFNGISSDPPMVAYGSNGVHSHGGPKDTLRNIEQTGVFVVNVATWALRDPMNASSQAHRQRLTSSLQPASQRPRARASTRRALPKARLIWNVAYTASPTCPRPNPGGVTAWFWGW